MPSNTNHKPTSIADFNANNLNFAGKGASGSCTVTSSSNPVASIDMTLTDDCLITGGILMVKNGYFTDKLSMQVVHPTLGVVSEYVTDFRVVEDSQRQFELNINYPAKIPAGMILRIKYTPSTDVGVRYISVNYMLHKVLF